MATIHNMNYPRYFWCSCLYQVSFLRAIYSSRILNLLGICLSVSLSSIARESIPLPFLRKPGYYIVYAIRRVKSSLWLNVFVRSPVGKRAERVRKPGLGDAVVGDPGRRRDGAGGRGGRGWRRRPHRPKEAAEPLLRESSAHGLA